jgi:hypothetical protein
MSESVGRCACLATIVFNEKRRLAQKKRQKTTSPLATAWLQRERAVPEGDRLTKTPTHHDPVFMLRECQCAQSLLRAGRAGMMSPPSGVV